MPNVRNIKMIQNFYPSSLYNFLRFTNSSSLEKKILDCGAGGSNPKLAFFYENGFDTYGIDVSEDSINWANEYCENCGINLKIIKADMRNIPFDTAFFSFVFSYNSIFHLNKIDTGIAIKEMYRVLKKGGLCYMNLLSKDDQNYGKGIEQNPGEIVTIEGNGKFFHSYYDDNEPDSYFKDFEIIYKEKRHILKGNYYNTKRTCIIDYIVKKP
ncbi:MAG: class I SAM-dependent methyltransferase [Candidatus Odinarchaeota archaeon]